MTARENLLRVSRHEQPAWIPVIAHLDPYNQPTKASMPEAFARNLGA